MNHGNREGKGKYIWTSIGASYDGDYSNNMKHGSGILIVPEKGRYEGAHCTSLHLHHLPSRKPCDAQSVNRSYQCAIPIKLQAMAPTCSTCQRLTGTQLSPGSRGPLHRRAALPDLPLLNAAIAHTILAWPHLAPCQLLLPLCPPAGSFVEDQLDGEGTYYYLNGDIYAGTWKANKKHGQGYYYFKVGGCVCVEKGGGMLWCECG